MPGTAVATVSILTGRGLRARRASSQLPPLGAADVAFGRDARRKSGLRRPTTGWHVPQTARDSAKWLNYMRISHTVHRGCVCTTAVRARSIGMFLA
jgi:hypothetical protein